MSRRLIKRRTAIGTTAALVRSTNQHLDGRSRCACADSGRCPPPSVRVRAHPPKPCGQREKGGEQRARYGKYVLLAPRARQLKRDHPDQQAQPGDLNRRFEDRPHAPPSPQLGHRKRTAGQAGWPPPVPAATELPRPFAQGWPCSVPPFRCSGGVTESETEASSVSLCVPVVTQPERAQHIEMPNGFHLRVLMASRRSVCARVAHNLKVAALNGCGLHGLAGDGTNLLLRIVSTTPTVLCIRRQRRSGRSVGGISVCEHVSHRSWFAHSSRLVWRSPRPYFSTPTRRALDQTPGTLREATHRRQTTTARWPCRSLVPCCCSASASVACLRSAHGSGGGSAQNPDRRTACRVFFYGPLHGGPFRRTGECRRH